MILLAVCCFGRCAAAITCCPLHSLPCACRRGLRALLPTDVRLLHSVRREHWEPAVRRASSFMPVIGRTKTPPFPFSAGGADGLGEFSVASATPPLPSPMTAAGDGDVEMVASVALRSVQRPSPLRVHSADSVDVAAGTQAARQEAGVQPPHGLPLTGARAISGAASRVDEVQGSSAPPHHHRATWCDVRVCCHSLDHLPQFPSRPVVLRCILLSERRRSPQLLRFSWLRTKQVDGG